MALTGEGLEFIAELTAGLDATFIAIGDAEGEQFRKAVGAVIRSGTLTRFRTTLSLTEGNGVYTFMALYVNATAAIGSGTKLGQIPHNFSKTANQVLNLEYKLTSQQGV